MDKKLYLLFTLILFISLPINAQDTLVIERNYLPYADTTLIFMPDSVSKTENLPLVILLHGWSGNYKQWNEIVNLDSLAESYRFIFATPEGFYDSWYLDNPERKNYKWETFFVKDLVPALTEKYNIDTSKIFISGLSMGGHGAITMFIKHNDLFSSAGSTSGILDITEFPGKWELDKALGNYENHKVVWENNSAFHLIDKLENKNKQFIIDCGTEDFAFPVNAKFFHKCKKMGLKITFIARPGKHEKKYWAESIIYHLDFFKKISTEKN